jgi:hypothetical protein
VLTCFQLASGRKYTLTVTSTIFEIPASSPRSCIRAFKILAQLFFFSFLPHLPPHYANEMQTNLPLCPGFLLTVTLESPNTNLFPGSLGPRGSWLKARTASSRSSSLDSSLLSHFALALGEKYTQWLIISVKDVPAEGIVAAAMPVAGTNRGTSRERSRRLVDFNLRPVSPRTQPLVVHLLKVARPIFLPVPVSVQHMQSLMKSRQCMTRLVFLARS